MSNNSSILKYFMMNSFLYRGNATLLKRSVALLFVSMFAVVAWAQSFTISHTMTPGTCIADASLKIDVTPTNMPAGTQYQYTLYNLTTGAPGLPVVSADLSYTFRDLTAGTYRVEVLARGTSLAPQVRNNVTVTTTYVPTTVALDLVNSREAYSCGSGRIVLTIQNGKGSYEVKIVSGPMRVGEIIPYTQVPSRTPSLPSHTYQLEGENWLPGNYAIEVRDADCGNVTHYSFTLSAMDVPEFYEFNHGFPNPFAAPHICDELTYSFKTTTISEAHKKYIDQGLYEVGFLYPGQLENDVRYYTTTPNLSFIRANAYLPLYDLFKRYGTPDADKFYNIVPVKYILRLKSCPQVQTIGSTHLKERTRFVIQGRNFDCSDLNVPYGLDSYNPLCFPVQYRVSLLEGPKEAATKTLIGVGEQSTLTSARPTFEIPPALYSKNSMFHFLLEATDANGKVFVDTLPILKQHDYTLRPSGCSPFYDLYVAKTIHLTGVYYSLSCGLEARVYDKSGTMLKKVSTRNRDGRFVLDSLEYNKDYTIQLVVSSTGEKVYERNVNQYQRPNIDRFEASVYPLVHKENYGSFQVLVGRQIGKGSVITVTSPSNQIYTYIYDSENMGQYRSVVVRHMHIENGTYKIHFHNTCDGKDSTIYYTPPLMYQVHDLKATFSYDCGSAILTPSATVTLGGEPLPSNKYAFIVHPKDNKVDQKVASPGEGIQISGDGEYVVSVVVEPRSYSHYVDYLNYPDSVDWRLVDKKISYVTPSLNIDTERSMTYVCGTSSLGTILLTAKGGVAPYTYELYRTEADRDAGTNVLATQTGVDVRFDYGRMGDDYYVLVKDKCGSRFKHTVHLINITDLSAAYALPNRVCTGDPIQLRLIGPQTLKEASEVKWYRPNGVLLSNTPDIDIPDATVAHSGRYRAEFKLTGCDVGVVNYVDVVVDAPISVTSTPKTETVCVGKPVTLVGSTAPSGTTIYWELASERKYDPLGVLLGKPYQYSWEGQRLVGNTNESTHRAVFVRAGVYVVRPVYTNGGCFAEGAPITVNVKACTVPVNPHLMHRPIIDWSRFNSTPTTTI